MFTYSLVGWMFLVFVGLSFGSFLNVVIKRLPAILQRRWQVEARDIMATHEIVPTDTGTRFSLMHPRSHCPSCRTPLRWHDNIPLLGWFKRRGRCAACGASISWHYPAVEAASAALVILAIAVHGPGLEGLFIATALLILLTLAVIDAETLLLPDSLTLPLLWLGLLFHIVVHPDGLQSAVLGAIIGYSLLWSFFWLFKVITGKEGMGYGDFKMLAALGAWTGWLALPLILILSAGLGALISIAIQLLAPSTRQKMIPFGPYLAMSGIVMLLFGDTLMRLYSL